MSRRTGVKVFKAKSRASAVARQSTAQRRMLRMLAQRAVPQRQIRQAFNVPSGRIGEVKAVDITNGTVNLNTTMAIAILNPIQQGSGPSNRIGRRCKMTSLLLRGGLLVLRDGQAVIEQLRILVIYDRQPAVANGVGTLPTISDILQTVDQAGTAAAGGAFGFNNLNNSRRFLTLMDKKWTIPQTQLVAGDTTVMPVPNEHDGQYKLDEYIPLKGLEADFNGTAAPMTISNFTTGAIYLVTLGSVVATNECYGLNLQTRLKFVDL